MKMKPIKRFCLPGNITYYGTDIEVLIPEEYVEKDAEVRAVWVSTVANIDIPRMNEVNDEEIKKYKEYLQMIIDTVKEYKMNTVVFQVRPVGDALYASELNPWSDVLTGKEDKYPGFDVFGYFCDIAEKANVKVHAWVNPYRAGRVDINEANMTKEEFINTLSEKNFARKHPECTVLTKKNKLSLDPASEKVMEFVSDSVLEIAEKYNIKAVHIDDYFYPYEGIEDPEEEAKAKARGFENLGDFRRDNVNRLIEMIHNKLNTLPKKVEFGISPFGIYRIKADNFEIIDEEKAWEYGSNNHPGCTTCYKGLSADVYYWMEKGWIDYVVPQAYWDLDNTTIDENGNEKCLVRYADVVQWWSWAAEKTNVKLYIGQGIYRVSREGNWSNSDEIPNQLLYNQTVENVMGTVFFTFKTFLESNETLNETKIKLKKMWTKEVPDEE